MEPSEPTASPSPVTSRRGPAVLPGLMLYTRTVSPRVMETNTSPAAAVMDTRSSSDELDACTGGRFHWASWFPLRRS